MDPKKKQKKTISESISGSKAKTRAKGVTPSLEALIVGLSSRDDGVRVKARHSLVALGKTERIWEMPLPWILSLTPGA